MTIAATSATARGRSIPSGQRYGTACDLGHRGCGGERHSASAVPIPPLVRSAEADGESDEGSGEGLGTRDDAMEHALIARGGGSDPSRRPIVARSIMSARSHRTLRIPRSSAGDDRPPFLLRAPPSARRISPLPPSVDAASIQASRSSPIGVVPYRSLAPTIPPIPSPPAPPSRAAFASADSSSRTTSFMEPSDGCERAATCRAVRPSASLAPRPVSEASMRARIREGGGGSVPRRVPHGDVKGPDATGAAGEAGLEGVGEGAGVGVGPLSPL